MKYIAFLICTVVSFSLKAQVPQIHISTANISVYGDLMCSDGNTIYYLRKNTPTSLSSVISLYKIVGNATTPTFVKDLFKEDTTGIPTQAGNFEHQLKQVECVNGIFYMMYWVKPSLFSTSITGWRLLTSDGTAVGTQLCFLENTPISITSGTFPTGLYKANDGVYVWTNKFIGNTVPNYQGKLYKSMGTPATTVLAYTSAVDEESLTPSNFNFSIKNNWVYFAARKYVSGFTKNRYYRCNGISTEFIKEVDGYATTEFQVSDNDMLISYGTYYTNLTTGLPNFSIGFKKISLSAGFTELATFAPENSTEPVVGFVANRYEVLITAINSTYYFQGNYNSTRGIYRINPDNTINFWQLPLNAGATYTAPFGSITTKRSQNRVYLSHFYSEHKYAPTTAYTPANARTSSLYYLTGTDPILVDSINALRGTISTKTNFCGDVIYNETEYNSTYPYAGSFLKQNKLWRSDGTLAGTGFYNNLQDCTPLAAYYLPDLNPTVFLKHGGEMMFLGLTGCTYSDGVALYKIPQCNDALAMFRNAAATTTVSDANYTEGNRVFPFAKSKADSVLVAVYPNGLSLGNISTTVFNEANNVVAGGYTFLRRHYLINPTADPAGTKKVRLYFSAADFAALQVADPSLTSVNQLQVIKYDGPTEDGVFNAADATSLIIILPTSITTGMEYGANYLEFDVSGFSEFWINKGSVALPLTLLYFNAQKQNEGALLQWHTENEINVNRFEVERSTNGVQFENIASVNAKNQSENFYILNNNLNNFLKNNQVFYYRIKQIDADGKYKYSTIVKVSFAKNNAISIFPMPANNFVQINSSIKINQVQLISVNGQVVKVFAPVLNQLYNTVDVAAGIYYLKITTEKTTEVTKIIIQH